MATDAVAEVAGPVVSFTTPPTYALVARVRPRPTLASLLAGGMTLGVRCPVRCRTHAQLLTRGLKRSGHGPPVKPLVFGAATRTLSAGRLGQVVIQLNGVGRRALAHASHVWLTLEVIASMPLIRERLTKTVRLRFN